MPTSMMRLGFNLGVDLAMLSMESQQVVALRLMRLALGGPEAVKETQRMVSEKAVAAVESGISIASGASAENVVRAYRKKVRANRKRLQKNAVGFF